MKQQLIEESKDDDQHVNLFKQEQLNQLEKERQSYKKEVDESFNLGNMVNQAVQRPWYMKVKQPEDVTKSLEAIKASSSIDDQSKSKYKKSDKKEKKAKKDKKLDKKEKKREVKRQLKDLKQQIAIQRDIEIQKRLNEN